jgi:plasmid replication initiation protein
LVAVVTLTFVARDIDVEHARLDESTGVELKCATSIVQNEDQFKRRRSPMTKCCHSSVGVGGVATSDRVGMASAF